MGSAPRRALGVLASRYGVGEGGLRRCFARLWRMSLGC
jgi:hypothetical protein